ncbi:hypothetical protein PAAG_01116 [Paracoccidioides lutzii Pb01]|uniref:Uncharacterized protein n=1 Tax=Paracoccidioides lutzii (strain ATCC MYA-826 / Pb01) TaxID=502779 RepID=C1GRH1_PARBA|nr:hypothetical protein PAAG_01116 [Paracoccidioides lutzii Pb01]EEH38195.1 hypothetical protein PAAG_01116 [Paracoccidioides lutzii Pb01]
MPYLGSTERPLATDGTILRSQTSLRADFMIDRKSISIMAVNLSTKRLGLIPVPALRDQDSHYDPQRTTAKWYYLCQLGYPNVNGSLET